MIHSVDEELAVEDIDVEVVTAVWSEVTVHEVDEVVYLCLIFLAESRW